MNSTILQIASKYIRFILVLIALLALWRGHNHPGGGFIGGLIAALSVTYMCYAYTVDQVEKSLKIKPEMYVFIGLIVVILSVIPGLIATGVVMHGEWFSIPVFGLGSLKVGTPFVFDIGVFFVVIGITLLFLFSLFNKK